MKKRFSFIQKYDTLTITVFALSIVSGSFLLFQVQPVISKYILPWFGGTSAVWTTALLFFQFLLLVGYFYVFLLSRLTVKKQVLLHMLLLTAGISTVFMLFFLWQAPILPGIGWKLPDAYSPIIQVLGLLFISVGLPYFILSTTSVLLQKWFSLLQPAKSPYILYALSNVASLTAILSYPVLIEPLLKLHTQGIFWSFGYLSYSIFFLIASALTITKYKKQQSNRNPTGTLFEIKDVTRLQIIFWFLLPAISSIMLLSVTNLLTQYVAPIPFLWMLPLSLYLASYILTFSNSKLYIPNLYAYIYLILMPFGFLFTLLGTLNLIFGIIICSLLLFSCFMLCHGEVYRLRPHPKQLDLFYLANATGSVIGALIVSIIAPLFFKGLWETYLGLYLTYVIVIAILLHYKNSFLYRHMHILFVTRKEAAIALSLLPVFVFACLAVLTQVENNTLATYKWRNFYGVLSINKKVIKGDTFLFFNHGNILHGLQYTTGPKRYEPNSYLHKKSGVGLALTNYPRSKNGMRVAIMGLGVGTLATYGQKGDFYRFYEINPQVVDIANKYFTYLQDTKAATDIVLGDARLSLLKENSGKKQEKYDVLIMDAFTSDAIPVHLLTKEAFAIYLDRIITPKGVIAVNISNMYIDLKPVLMRIANYYGLNSAFILTQGKDENFKAEWALLTYNKDFLKIPVIEQAKTKNWQTKQVDMWTDDYSNLFQILR